MSKKLVKLTSVQLLKNWKELKQEYLTFILGNKTSHLAKIENFEKKKFYLKNSRGYRIELPLQEIQEVWQEVKVTDT